MPRLQRHELWTVVAIVILVIATTIALTRQQANFDDHERLDRHTCTLAHQNRLILRDTIQVLEDDAGARTPEAQARLVDLNVRIKRLIRQSEVCDD